MSRTCELFLKSTHELCQYIITSLLVCCKIFGLVHFTVLPIYEFCNSAANKELLQQIKVFVGAMKSVKAVTRNADKKRGLPKLKERRLSNLGFYLIVTTSKKSYCSGCENCRYMSPIAVRFWPAIVHEIYCDVLYARRNSSSILRRTTAVGQWPAAIDLF